MIASLTTKPRESAASSEADRHHLYFATDLSIIIEVGMTLTAMCGRLTVVADHEEPPMPPCDECEVIFDLIN